jgi:hypothetical protein
MPSNIVFQPSGYANQTEFAIVAAVPQRNETVAGTVGRFFSDGTEGDNEAA